MASKKRSAGKLWHIFAEGFGECYVTAENWEQATIEAAKAFGAPWRTVACKCQEISRSAYTRNVCPKCGRVFNTNNVLCPSCREREHTYLPARKMAAAAEI